MRGGRDWVAILLAVGIATAVNIITFGVLYDALRNPKPGVVLSDNAVQILSTAFGGILGVLGSYVGFKAGQLAGTEESPAGEPSTPGLAGGEGVEPTGQE